MHHTQLLEQLRAGKHTAALKELYKAWPPVRHFIKTHGGNEDDARDVFQESLLIFYKNVQKKDFALTAQVGTYLFSICKYLWKDELKKKNRVVSFDCPERPEEISDFHEYEEKTRWLNNVLTSIGEKCATMLRLFYYKKMSMDEIAIHMGYKNTDTAKTQKYKCIEQARNLAAGITSSQVNETL
jgi:RNA polymerase sigma factor (sigma-70 family)